MRITLYYNFIDETCRDDKDTFKLTMINFPFDIETNDDKLINTSWKDLYESNRNLALELAAEKWMCDYADFAFNVK